MWKLAALPAAIAMTMALARQPALMPAHAEAPLRVILANTDGLVPLERVLAMLRKRYSGEQLDAQIVRNSPAIVFYEIQWLTQEGRKIVFIVNARDGKIVATRGLENNANPGR
jgi:hypothetical protein